MAQYRRRFAACLLMTLLAVLMTSSISSGEWKYVPAGWTATEPGYFGSEQDGRDTLEAVRTYREERDSWRRAFEEARDENRDFQAKMEERFSSLEKSLEAERTAWKREIRKAKAPGFGVFAGYGLNDHGEGDFVIGAGIVWRLW